MINRYVIKYCTVALLMSSSWVFAQHGTPRGNQAEINEVVKNYLEALQAGRYAEVVNLLKFHDSKEREEFQEEQRRRGASLKWDLNQEIHLVRVVQKKGHVQALYLLPTKHGYLPERLSVQYVRGQPKLVYEKKSESEDRNLDVFSAKLAELGRSLNDWKFAEGKALAEKALVLKDRLQEEIDALDYAKEKNLHVVPGYGGLKKRRVTYDAVRDLSDNELRLKMMEEIQSVLEALSP